MSTPIRGLALAFALLVSAPAAANGAPDRWSYWPIRIARGGEVLAPGDPTQPVSIIDARDLAEWTVRLCEDDTGGVFNATGPESLLSMAEMLYGCRAASSADVRFTWVDWAFLQEQGVTPWGDMPAWIPKELEGYAGAGTRSRAAAVAAGLSFRPLAVTAMDTLAWWAEQPEERRTLRAGIAPEREAEVLAAWHEANG